MRLLSHPLFRLKPILVGVSLFGLMWTVMNEVNLRRQFSRGLTGSHVKPGLYYYDIVEFLLLVIASLSLSLSSKRRWCYAVAGVLSAAILLNNIFYFRRYSQIFAVPLYSFTLLKQWFFFFGDDFLRLALPSTILVYSILSLVRLTLK
jgi:hypothetical protein